MTTKPTEAQEREAFEAWARPKWRSPLDWEDAIGAPGNYSSYELNAARIAWQARAALAATPAEPVEAVTLLKRAARQIERWSEKYGEWQPQWLPPAGDVRLLEDIDAYMQPPPAPVIRNFLTTEFDAARLAPIAQPLSDEALDLLCEKAIFCRISFQQLARAVEAEHGIKGEVTP